MKNTHQVVRTISEIGMFAAIGYVIDELQGIIGKGLFVNGGSIGFAMIAVIIISIRRGWLSGIITGLIMGLFDFATGAYILHPAQAMLDYILPYAIVGLSGLLVPIYRDANDDKQKILVLCLLVTVGGLLKFLSHYLAGVIFWVDASGFAWGLNYMNPYLYALIYNIAYIGPTIIICIVLIILIYKKAPRILTVQDIITEKPTHNNSNVLSYAFSGILITGGTFLFIFFLIKFIESIYNYTDGEAFGFEANGDCMIIFIMGLFIATIGVTSLIKTIQNKVDRSYVMFVLSAQNGVSVIYAIARLIRCYNKGLPVADYWVWLFVSLALQAITLAIAFMFKASRDNEITVIEEKEKDY
ncbi:MAG: energy-coupled thiamine transporter ThiT [Bacilli bacterium]|nr:energy-coupled thiamine transporter ThiT [Bacilli bacterium]